MVHNDTDLVAKSCNKVAQSFYCENCDYSTSRKSSWKKHLETRKHNGTQMVHNDTDLVAKSCTTTTPLATNVYTCECGRTYKYHSGYYRHKHKCDWKHDTNVVVEHQPEQSSTAETLKGIADAVKALSQLSIATANALGSNTSHISGSGSHNTINNQKIYNVNLFLNEKCGEAMCIQDFARNLQLTLADLDESRPEAIRNVVLKNLQPLTITDRPFHCTDAEKSEWYINDKDNGWEPDSGAKVLESAQHGIRRQWPSEFSDAHPDWSKSETLQDKYVTLAAKTNSDLGNKERKKVLDGLARETVLTKDVIDKIDS